MSLEQPGDGVSCDHCGIAADSTRDRRQGSLAPFTGELLCSLCMEVKRLHTPIDITVVEREGAIPRIVTIDPLADPMARPNARRYR